MRELYCCYCHRCQSIFLPVILRENLIFIYGSQLVGSFLYLYKASVLNFSDCNSSKYLLNLIRERFKFRCLTWTFLLHIFPYQNSCTRSFLFLGVKIQILLTNCSALKPFFLLCLHNACVCSVEFVA